MINQLKGGKVYLLMMSEVSVHSHLALLFFGPVVTEVIMVGACRRGKVLTSWWPGNWVWNRV